MPGEALAYDFVGRIVGNHVIKAESDPFEYRRSGMDADRIIIVKRGVIRNPDFNDWINITTFFDFAIGIGHVAHQ